MTAYDRVDTPTQQGRAHNDGFFYFPTEDPESQSLLGPIPVLPQPVRAENAGVPRAPATHLILVHHLDEEREGKADLRQLGDGHAVLRAVELRRIVIDVNNQDVEGGGDGGI